MNNKKWSNLMASNHISTRPAVNYRVRRLFTLCLLTAGLFLLFVSSTSAQCTARLLSDISDIEGVRWDGSGLVAINGYSWQEELIVTEDGDTRTIGVLVDPQGNRTAGSECKCSAAGVCNWQKVDGKGYCMMSSLNPCSGECGHTIFIPAPQPPL